MELLFTDIKDITYSIKQRGIDIVFTRSVQSRQLLLHQTRNYDNLLNSLDRFKNLTLKIVLDMDGNLIK